MERFFGNYDQGQNTRKRIEAHELTEELYILLLSEEWFSVSNAIYQQAVILLTKPIKLFIIGI